MADGTIGGSERFRRKNHLSPLQEALSLYPDIQEMHASYQGQEQLAAAFDDPAAHKAGGHVVGQLNSEAGDFISRTIDKKHARLIDDALDDFVGKEYKSFLKQREKSVKGYKFEPHHADTFSHLKDPERVSQVTRMISKMALSGLRLRHGDAVANPIAEQLQAYRAAGRDDIPDALRDFMLQYVVPTNIKQQVGNGDQAVTAFIHTVAEQAKKGSVDDLLKGQDALLGKARGEYIGKLNAFSTFRQGYTNTYAQKADTSEIHARNTRELAEQTLPEGVKFGGHATPEHYATAVALGKRPDFKEQASAQGLEKYLVHSGEKRDGPVKLSMYDAA